jgi:hypothetical protein
MIGYSAVYAVVYTRIHNLNKVYDYEYEKEEK